MNHIKKLYYKFQLKILFSSSKKAKFSYHKGKKKCFVCLAADYGNLGDVAITYAQSLFLQKKFPDYEIIDIPISQTLSQIKVLKKICTPTDIVTIVGGGNMGDMYYDIELLRLLIIKNFPNNRIISFPQTIDYSNTKEALWLRTLSKKIYEKHQSLRLCAREMTSYRKMQELYPHCNIILAPDIVMSLNESMPQNKRNCITFCLRNDKEQSLTQETITALRNKCIDTGLPLINYDTHIGDVRLTLNERIRELQKIWKCFRKSQLIITDRLHGMIFAYITQTPAIVLPNSNFKIQGCFEWIKNCGYIYFTENNKPDVSSILKANTINNYSNTHRNIIKELDKIVCI